MLQFQKILRVVVLFLSSETINCMLFGFKAAVLHCSKNKKWKRNNGKYWSSYVQWRNLFYWPLKLTKSLVNIDLFCIIYCVTNAVAVMYSRNIPMAEKRIVCFQSKKVKICRFFLFLTTIIYIWRDILKYL